MDLSVLFLGTAGSMPTVQRAPASVLVRRGGDRILIDCGEGTQRQLLRSVGLPDVEHVFLTHFHADHFLGLPGMLKTFALRGREVPLTVYGPRGLRGLMSDLRRVYGRLTYEVEPPGAAPSDAVELDGYRIGAYAAGTASRRSATRWSRTSGRDGSTQTAPASWASRRALSRAPAAGRAGGGQRARGRAAGGDGGGARRPQARVHRRHRALRHDGRGRAGRRAARPRRHLRRRGERARPQDRTLDRRARRQVRPSGRASRCSRSRTCRRATSHR